MQKVLNKILSFGAALALCLGITAVVHSPSTLVTDGASDYYASITEKKGDALLGQVHDLITTTHTRYTSYADCKTYGPTTDPGLDGKGALEFYTHETIMEFVVNNNPGMWNREHVWAQSLSKQPGGGQLWGTDGGGSDLHHLRPSEVKLNAARGNYRYGEVKNGSATYSKTTSGGNSLVGGYIGSSENGSGTAFEPLENVKGDIARIVMYVYTHYNTYQNVSGTTNGGSDKMGYFGTLKFTQIISANTESEAIKILLAWNKSDPVDQIERTRNEETYKLQKNRNAFIDHPEYADAIWGDGTITPGGDVGGGHVCGSSCVTCGKCTDKFCDNAACSEKCQGHGDVGGGHVCGSSCVTCGKCTDKFCDEAACSEKCQGHGDVGGPEEVDSAKLSAFHTAVRDIVTEGTLSERLASINKAITVYQGLSAAERAAAAEDVQALQAAIADYNKAVGAYNEELDKANKGALGGAGGFFH